MVDIDILKRFADRLYKISKTETIERPLLTLETRAKLVNLAKMMYRIAEEQRVGVSGEELNAWHSDLLEILGKFGSEDKGTEISREIENIDKRILGWIAPVEQFQTSSLHTLDMLTSTSVLLGSTLWFGGYNFSMSYDQLSSELGFSHNKTSESAFKRLKGNVFVELENKVIVLNPRYSSLVEKAVVYLIGLGTGFKIIGSLTQKRHFLTMQEGFLALTRNKTHPLVPFFENARGYVSDYCQRVFGRLYEELERKEVKVKYNSLRRLVLRISLLPSFDFASSNEPDIESILKKLETFGMIERMSTIDAGEVILLESEVLKY